MRPQHFFPVEHWELKGHVDDVISTSGGIPLTLRNGDRFLAIRYVAARTKDNRPAVLVTDPRLKEWPLVSLCFDPVSALLRFVIEEWKNEDWCSNLGLYAPGNNDTKVKIGRRMLADDPLTEVNA
jgi:hypothetical protein